MKLYDKIKLLNNRFSHEGAACGDKGYIIEMYDDGNCEVELSDVNGNTYAQIVVTPDDVALENEVE